MAVFDHRILILCKTYPSPSAKYAETSCVAGVDEQGKLVRLYPVPFRLIGDEKQFRKWQWVDAKVEKSRNDHRPESHKLFVDTIRCDEAPIPTTNNWQGRRAVLDKINVFSNFADVEAARQSSGVSLALLRSARIMGLDIKSVDSPNWTEAEKAKLISLQNQADLFDDTDKGSVAQLRKLPYDFHYRYECDTPDGPVSFRHKLVDWEIGALFWNVHRAHGDAWEKPFRDKLERDLPSKDLMFLLGTIHRFPDQWLIVSLIYPPKQPPSPEVQESLF